jgi:hypothetical protein
MLIPHARLISSTISLGILAVTILLARRWWESVITGLLLVMPVALIWYAEPLGEHVDRDADPRVAEKHVPAKAIEGTGWGLLVGLPLFLLVVK